MPDHRPGEELFANTEPEPPLVCVHVIPSGHCHQEVEDQYLPLCSVLEEAVGPS